MAKWSASLDASAPRIVIDGTLYPAGGPNPREERPNWAGYYTFTAEDGRQTKRRVGFTPLDAHQPEQALADICEALALEDQMPALIDQRMVDMAAAMRGRSFVPGTVDITKPLAARKAKAELLAKVNAAIVQPGTIFTRDQIASARAVDPTVADTLAALEAAQTG